MRATPVSRHGDPDREAAPVSDVRVEAYEQELHELGSRCYFLCRFLLVTGLVEDASSHADDPHEHVQLAALVYLEDAYPYLKAVIPFNPGLRAHVKKIHEQEEELNKCMEVTEEEFEE